MTGRILRYALALLLAAAALVTLLLVSPQWLSPVVQPVRTLLVDALLRSVSGSLQGSIEIGELSGSLLSDPVVSQFRILDAEGSPLLTIEQTRVRYRLGAILQGRLLIEEVGVERPWVRLAEDAGGQLTLQRVFEPLLSTEPASDEDSTFALALELDALRLEDGSLEVELPTVPGVETVDGLALALTAGADATGLRLRIRKFTAGLQPAGVRVEELTGALEYAGERLRLTDWRLTTGASRIRLGGVFPGTRVESGPRLELQPLDVAEIGRLLADRTLRGSISGDLRVSGELQDLGVDAALEVGTGSINLDGEFDVASANGRYSGQLEVSGFDPTALIDRPVLAGDVNFGFSFQAEGNGLNDLVGEAEFDLKPSSLGEVALRRSRLAVSAQSGVFRILALDLDTSVLKGSGEGEIALNGRSDLKYRLTAELDQLQTLLGLERLYGDLELTGGMQGTWPAVVAAGELKARELAYENTRVEKLDLSFSAEDLGATPTVRANLRLGSSQVAGTPVAGATAEVRYTLSDTRQEADFSAELRQSDAVQARLSGGLDLSGQALRVALDALEFELGGRDWANETALELNVAPNRYELSPMSFRHGGERVAITGALIDNRFRDVALNVDALDLDFIREMFALPTQISGRADLELRVEGSLEQPQFDAVLGLRTTAESLTTHWERLDLQAAYDDRRLTLNTGLDQRRHRALALEIVLPANLALVDMPMEARLADAPLSLSLDLDRLDLGLLTQGLAGAVEGVVGGTLAVAGTYAAVDVDGDLSLAGGDVGEVAQDIEALMKVDARLETASTVAELQAGIRDGVLTPRIPEFMLEIPSLSFQSPGSTGDGSITLGDLEIAGRGEWTTDGPGVQVSRASLSAEVPDYPPTRLSLTADLTPERLVVREIQASTPDSGVTGELSYGLRDGAVDLTLDISALELRELIAGLPPETPSILSGRIGVSGTATAPMVDANLSYVDALIRARGDAQLAEIPPRYQARVDLEGLDLEVLALPATGSVSATLELEGSGFDAAERTAKLQLDLEGPELSLAPGLRGLLRLGLAGSTLNVDTFEVDSVPFSLRAEGVVAQQAASDLRYTLDLGDLSPLEPLLGAPTEVSGRIQGTLSGTDGDLQATNAIDIGRWRYGSFQGGAVRGRLDVDGLTGVPGADLSLSLAEIRGEGLAPSTLALTATYLEEGGNIDLSVGEGPLEGSMVRGRFALAGGVDATLDTFRLQHLTWVWQNTRPVGLGSDPSGAWLRDLELKNGGQRLAASAELAADGGLSGVVEIEGLEIGGVMEVFAPESTALDGVLSARFDAGGSVGQPKLTGSLDATGLAQGTSELGDLRAEIETRGEVIGGSARWLYQGEPVLTAEGRWDAAQPQALDVRILGEALELARLEPLSNQILASSGSLDVDLRVAGVAEAPEVFGTVEVRDGELQLALLGERFSAIQSRLVFEGNRLDIEQLEVRSSTGSARIGGQVRTRGLALDRVDVALRSENFTVISTREIGAEVTTEVDVGGSADDLAVTGEIIVNRATYRYDGLPSGGPATIEPWELTVEGVFGPGPPEKQQAVGRPSTSGPPPLPFLRVDLVIDIPRNAWVQSTGTSIEMRGRLKVTKDLKRPIIVSGNVRTVRGFVTLLGRRFTVENGDVVFTGTPEINPVLDVVAQHRVADYDVFVEVSGESSEPEIAFRSSPELPESDVMSLLIFGRTGDKLSSSEQGSLSGALAGGVASSILENTIGRTLGVDSLNVDLSEPDAATFGVGHYLTNDVYLSYDRTFRDPKKGNVGGSTVGIEYTFTPRFRVRGTGSDFGETAIDFIWGFDY